MAGFAVPTFSFGGGAQAKTPQEAARLRETTAALMSRMSTPQNVGQGLGALGNAFVVRALNDRASAGEEAGQAHAAELLKTLQGGSPSQADLVGAVSDPWVAQNPGESAVAQTLLQRGMQQNDPSYQLEQKYKQAQIDAITGKSDQPLKMSSTDVLLDPNTHEQIWPPKADPAAAPPAVGFAPDGTVDPAAQDQFLKTLDPKDAVLIKGIINYELDPAKVLSMRGGGESERQRLITLAKQADPTYDGTQFGVRQAVRKDFTSGQSAMNLKSANTLIGHLHELLGASDALGNTNFPLVNAGMNAFKSGTGSPDPVRYGLAAQASADELAKVFKGGGASDVESIKGWQGKLDPNASPAQQKEAVTEAIKLLQSRISALRDQYQSATGKPANFTFLDTKAANAIKDLGFEPTDIDPNYVDKGGNAGAPGAAAAPAGQTTKSIGGKTYVQDQNGDWYEQ